MNKRNSVFRLSRIEEHCVLVLWDGGTPFSGSVVWSKFDSWFSGMEGHHVWVGQIKKTAMDNMASSQIGIVT